MTYPQAVALMGHGADMEEAPPRWTEHPPGVNRALGWHIRNTIENMCAEASRGRVPRGEK